MRDYISILILLLGADPNKVDHMNRTAIVIAFMILETDYFREILIIKSKSPQLWPTTESDYSPLVRLLLLKGVSLPHGWERRHFEKYEPPPWLHQLYIEAQKENRVHASQPPSLIHISRISIRLHLGSVRKIHCIEQLPLPKELNDFIALQYL